MKTISELSGTVIRMAAAALAEARRSLPREEPPPPSPAATDAAPETSEPLGDAAAPGEVTAGAVPTDAAEAAPPSPSPEPRPESDAVKAALDEAVAKATGFSGDRLAMLRAAVEIATPRIGDVRLVRVFGVDEKLSGARIVGEYQYVVDLFPAAMKQTGAPREERGGGRRGGGGGGGKGGGGAGARGAKGSATGGFSMDSLRDDRRKEGGGRGRAGGARRPGGGPARPSGGTPKK